jgi:FkbM family methyltransferase
MGLFSICAAVNLGCRVYAFEPDPNNYERSWQNVLLNKLENKIEIFKRGLWERDAATPFYQNEAIWTTQSQGFMPCNSKAKTCTTMAISAETMFSLIKEPIYYLKCNCEGGEIFLLEYLMAHSAIAYEIDRISIEVHPGMVPSTKLPLLNDAVRWFKEIRKGLKTEIRISMVASKEDPKSYKWMEEYSL